jgi:hypothetical protein
MLMLLCYYYAVHQLLLDTDYDDRRHDGSDAGDDQEDAALTKKELKYLLTHELGIVMGAEEMRRLVDAFDANKVCA